MVTCCDNAGIVRVVAARSPVLATMRSPVPFTTAKVELLAMLSTVQLAPAASVHGVAEIVLLASAVKSWS